jgi:hypothetical protein
VPNPKRPRDPNQRAKLIVDIATGESRESKAPRDDSSAARGRKGGLKGGPTRAARLTPKERSEIVKKAARPRWHSAAAGVADHVRTPQAIASLSDSAMVSNLLA